MKGEQLTKMCNVILMQNLRVIHYILQNLWPRDVQDDAWRVSREHSDVDISS